MIKLDLFLIFLILLLYLIGFYTAYGITLVNQKNLNSGFNFFIRYIILNIFLPLCVFVILSFIKWQTLKKLTPFLFFLSLLFLILAFIPIFKLPGQNTARWFNLGPISFQPTEFIKFSTLLFLAFLVPLIKKDKDYLIFSILVIAVISILIFKQPALSNLLIFLVSIIGAFISIKFSYRNLILIGLLIITLIFLSFFQEYRIKRIIGIIKGDEKGIAFQLKQTKSAISSGGLLGKGLGNSDFKVIGIPLMMTDSIFAIYAEETGFVGSLFLISLFILLVLKIFYKANQAKDESKKFFAYGVGCWISAQAFIHIVSNILITTGVPLPFISYGPSSQLSIMASLGIINNLENS